MFETTSPIDGSFLMNVSRAKAADVDAAVRSAASSAPSWGADGSARATVMRQIANEIRQQARALGTIETLDSGRAIADTAGASVVHSAGLFDYYAGLADKLHGSTVPMGREATALVEREPFGVIAAIAPWNYPLLNAATKIAPIIACGNTLVLKPAEQTPLVTLILARLMQQAGLPDGVVNIVTGFGAEAGAPLVAHPDVGKISFTGSSATGRHIAAEAGRSLKGVVLELGGKSPLVVFEDADLQRAARAAVFSTFMNAGQTCTSCARVLVAHDVLEQFEAHCRAEAASLRVGDPLDPETQIGPIVSVEQLERVRRLTAGVSGEQVAKKEYRPIGGGHFFPPTIVSRFPADSDFAREEIFGPVMAIRSFQSDEEAWSLANDTAYGLAGSVWTSSLHRAEQARRRLQCGIVWINCVHSLSAGTPVSGHKTSGLGIEYGLEAADQYMKVKTTVMMSGAWNSPFATRL
ncbi:aldehyde dehydrogenase (NAD+) [Bradyrhizobium sp. CIR48]|uniref:aldehyde dehydrogenase family protein n=1 Tax=Bradyrhizobium sp. CIR48 TaxID=2663840 RepID=UPI001606ED25|nr:aldehyde dehydrogenase family protein [Bradyrhizobium sp. CIR48]MBB4427583.1 aldehyde dehydrogenase (NAD+) [Bradyrhizobium sp. CIR48]